MKHDLKHDTDWRLSQLYRPSYRHAN